MNFSASLALAITSAALIADLSIPALHAQDGALAPMGLTYRSAFDPAPEPVTEIAAGEPTETKAMTPPARMPTPAAATAPVMQTPEQPIPGQSPARRPSAPTPGTALSYSSVFESYDRYEEVGDPDWVAANDAAAAAGGWQAYATQLYRFNKAREEASKAVEAGAQPDGSDGETR